MTERRALVEILVKEIVDMPDNALMGCTVPCRDDKPHTRENAEEMALNGSVLSTVQNGGLRWTVDGTIFEVWPGAV